MKHPTPHTLIPARTGGYIVVSALILMVVLMLLASIILTGSVSSMQQAGSQSGLVQARAVAEAGQASAIYTLKETIVPSMNVALSNYTTAFLQNGSNPNTTDIVIPDTDGTYTTVVNKLNAIPGLSETTAVGSGTYARTITFNNFRIDKASRNSQGQTYYVDYTVISTGTVKGFRRSVNVNGSVKMIFGRQALSASLLLADDGGSQQGNYYGTGMNYDGPVQINKNWRFAGSPNFKMGAKTAAKTVEMWNCNTSKWQGVSTQSNGCTTPNWNGFGMQYQVPAIELPTNSFSQARAALGKDATNTSPLSNSDRCSYLNVSCSGNNAPPQGVYLPDSGGIYVQGDASVTLSVLNGKQVYTIKQGLSVTVLTVTYPNGPTIMLKPDGITLTLAGRVPNGQLYVEGMVTSLSGPPRTGTLPNPLPGNSAVPAQIPPAIASDTKLNIAAASDILVQGDLTYQTNPIGNPGAQNVLGLIAGSGDIRVGTAAPKDIYIHAALLAGNASKGFKVDNYNSGAPRGSIHTLGSLAESVDPPRGVGSIDKNGNVSIVNGYGDDFHFDPRFTNGTMAPPFFPGTTAFSVQTALPTQRNWQEGTLP